MKGLLVLASLTLGLFAPQKGEEVPLHDFCPVLTDEKIDPAISTLYKEQRVYFCCNKCRKKFLENPEVYVANLSSPAPLAHNASPVSQEHHDSAGEEQGHGDEHKHATGHGNPQGIGRFVRFLGKFHPAVVHFPIALIVAAALAELLFLRSRRQLFSDAARFCIGTGAVVALIAAGLGWAAGHFASYPGELGGVLETHRWLGTSTALLGTLTAGFSELRFHKEAVWIPKAFRTVLFLTALLVPLTGYFGATLIYGFEHYSW